MNSHRTINSKADDGEVVPYEADCLLTKKELAQKLKKSVRSIENWMRLRYLPYIKIGHSVLFRWRDVVGALDHFQVR